MSDSRNLDDRYKRQKIKEERFKDKEYIKDEYTGKNLHISHADCDHITPLKVLQKKYPNVPVEKLKVIANSEKNIAFTHQSVNRSKGAKTNTKYIKAQTKTAIYNKDTKNLVETVKNTPKMVKKQISAEIDQNMKVGIYAINEIPSTINKESLKSAQNVGVQSALITGLSSSLNNISLVLKGERELDDALKDIAITTTKAGLTSASTQIILNSVTNTVCEEFARGFVGTTIPAVGISVAIASNTIKLLNGDITTEDCISSVITSGIGTLAYSFALVGTGGNVVAATVCSFVLGEIIKSISAYNENLKSENMQIQKRKQLYDKITKEALQEMEYQNKRLKDAIEEERLKWDTNTQLGYENIYHGILSNNVEQISLGLDNILEIFGEKSKFESLDDFGDFFNDDFAVLKL